MHATGGFERTMRITLLGRAGAAWLITGLGAVGAPLALAYGGSTPNAAPAAGERRGCPPGREYRAAGPDDRVCVTPESGLLVDVENRTAAERWTRGAYGAHTCVSGYVWREAFPGDDVCVTPSRRAAVRAENRAPPAASSPPERVAEVAPVSCKPTESLVSAGRSALALDVVDARGRPYADADVRIFGDSGIRCIRAPCGPGGQWSGRTDGAGRVVIPAGIVQRTTTLTTAAGTLDLIARARCRADGTWRVAYGGSDAESG
jgi:hypothetical protein